MQQFKFLPSKRFENFFFQHCLISSFLLQSSKRFRKKLDQIRYSYGTIYCSTSKIVDSFSQASKRIQIGIEIEAEDETDPRKQSHSFGDRYPRSSGGYTPPLAFARRELHSRVYHCPDNNDLPMVLVRGTRPTREERGRKEGRGERRSATLHSEVFHFNGPPGDWLTLLEDPSPFQHNGPLHYLFALANVPPEAAALVSTSFHFRVRLIANTESTFLLPFLQIQRERLRLKIRSNFVEKYSKLNQEKDSVSVLNSQ